MYIPPSSVKVDDIKSPQIRLLLIGKPGSGKTYSIVTTFPNVVVADWDNGLTSAELKGRAAYTLPFHDNEWVKKTFPNYRHPRDGFKYWLNTEARKLEKGQTLFIDSLSGLEDEFHRATELETPKNSDGVEDGYYLWEEKQTYLRDMHMILRSLKCHIVVSAHEVEERDKKTGILLSKVSPLLSGGFKGKLGKNYSDIFHAENGETKNSSGEPTGEIWYRWQCVPDNRYDLKTRLKLDASILIGKKYVKPGYEVFKQYMVE